MAARSPDPAALVWPDVRPTHGGVVLRAFADGDVDMVMDLARDPYVPTIGSLPADADRVAALAYLDRQRSRAVAGVGYSFCVADRVSDLALGGVGLWLSGLAAGRATAGYGVAPRARGRGVGADALAAVTVFGWTISALHRIELYVEPWNVASVRTAERAGFGREGLLRSHQEIGGHRVDMLLYAAVRPEPPS